MRRLKQSISARWFATTIAVASSALAEPVETDARDQPIEPAAPEGERSGPDANRANEAGETAGAETQQAASPSEDAIDRASRFFWEAHAEYELGNYQKAIALFERSYALAPHPETLYNLALSNANAGQCRDAQTKFGEFTKSVPDVERAGLARKAELLEKLCPTRTQDDSDSAHSEPATKAQREPAERDAPKVAMATSVTSMERPLPKTSAPASDDVLEADKPTTYWTSQRVLGWSLLGSALVATGAAVYFDDQRREASLDVEELERLEREGRAPVNAADQLVKRDADQRRARWATLATSAAATGFLLTGASLLLLEGGNDQRGASLSVTWRSGVSLGVGGYF